MASIDRRRRISAREFQREYLLPRRPVVIEGAMDDWPALGKWTQAWFKEQFGGEPVPVRMWTHQSEGPEMNVYKDTTLGEYIESFREARWADPRRPPYLSDWRAFDQLPALERDIGRLEFYPNWFSHLPRKLATKVYNWKAVLLSPRGAVYNLHHDEWAVHACVLQFEGRKKFVLYPPDQGRSLYFGQVDPDAPDLAKFPDFARAEGRIEAIVGPGDVIFSPSYWWHQVTSLDDSLSVVMHGLDKSNAVDAALEWMHSGLVEVVRSRRERVQAR